VGLGTPAKDATAPSTSLLLPHLRNAALKRGIWYIFSKDIAFAQFI